jgi:2-iminobutanoate/2-iminopropanoate deaminase
MLMRRLIALAFVALVPSLGIAQARPAPEFLQINPQSTAPFSTAVRVGNIIYLAGQLGTKDGALVSGGIGPETRQTLLNIKEVVEKAGSDMDHVVKCTVFLADMKEWPAMNDVYRTMFAAGKFPARSAFGATGLALNARTEIECIAVVK